MNLGFVLPAIILLGLTLTLGMGRWHLPPRPAIRALAAMAAIAATTVAIVVAATAAGFVLGPARRAEVIEWCRIVPVHHEVGTIAGVASLAAVGFMTIRVWLVLRRRRQATRDTAGRRLSVLETPAPIAYAAPGTPGCVVVSTGLLSALEPRERQVVFAHERAHLRQGHHHYVLAGALAVAIVPLLRPLVDRLRLATEYCADEEAAQTLGDRRLVATAIAKAALTKAAFNGVVPAFSGGPVVARVHALMSGPPSSWSTRFGLVAIAAGTVSAIAAGSIQLHHLWVLADHICHG